jgi:hypothetical protein
LKLPYTRIINLKEKENPVEVEVLVVMVMNIKKLTNVEEWAYRK